MVNTHFCLLLEFVLPEMQKERKETHPRLLKEPSLNPSPMRTHVCLSSSTSGQTDGSASWTVSGALSQIFQRHWFLHCFLQSPKSFCVLERLHCQSSEVCPNYLPADIESSAYSCWDYCWSFTTISPWTMAKNQLGEETGMSGAEMWGENCQREMKQMFTNTQQRQWRKLEISSSVFL